MRYFAEDYQKRNQHCIKTPRYRTVRECVAELKKLDNGTAVTEFFVRQLCKKKEIKYLASGSKSLVLYDDLLRYLGFIDTCTQTTTQKYFSADEDLG